MARSPTWEIIRDGDITRIEFNHSPTREEMVELMNALATVENSELRMYVMEKAEILLSTSEIREGAEIARSAENQPKRIAVVAPGSITYGISRIFKVFRESDETAFAIFRETEDASRWLTSGEPPPED